MKLIYIVLEVELGVTEIKLSQLPYEACTHPLLHHYSLY